MAGGWTSTASTGGGRQLVVPVLLLLVLTLLMVMASAAGRGANVNKKLLAPAPYSTQPLFITPYIPKYKD
ncbi:hypothetical protein OsI_37840 [Oryza sativa Indica Group]|uniref:Uncharacterized protein n=1 Tax=Oryza sativa subsp. indica TaxID=39946 RepID=B8BNP0_ORYSI|nr:hypothetical protein OsI_37840 [Oryza sativa Indica Group]